MAVTLQCVNHRFLDLRWQAPAEPDPILPELEKQVRRAVARGHLDIRGACECAGAPIAGSALPVLNEALAAAYAAAHVELSCRLHSTGPLRLPGVQAPAAVLLDRNRLKAPRWPPI